MLVKGMLQAHPPEHFRVYWTKGHATTEDIEEGRATPEDAYGNAQADQLATEGAKTHAVSETDAAGLLRHRRLAALMQAMCPQSLRSQHHTPAGGGGGGRGGGGPAVGQRCGRGRRRWTWARP